MPLLAAGMEVPVAFLRPEDGCKRKNYQSVLEVSQTGGQEVRHMSMIKVKELSFSYPTSGDEIFDHVSFQMDTDWKLGFVGRNGRGKTTLLKLLMGEY